VDGAGYVNKSVNGVPVVATPREIDLTTAEQLRAALLAAANHGHPTIVVDMSGTTFCDSAGLSTLVRAYERSQADDQQLRLVIPPDGGVTRIVTLTGVNRLIPCFSSLAAALDQASDGRVVVD
jgi:anti-sigma B factor antagonist